VLRLKFKITGGQVFTKLFRVFASPFGAERGQEVVRELRQRSRSGASRSRRRLSAGRAA
jgi:hypothetical protein